MLTKTIKNNGKPNGVMIGIINQFFFQNIDGHPFKGFDFVGVNLWVFVTIAHHNVVEFMFGQSVIKRGFVIK